jgi:hypothetical protein
MSKELAEAVRAFLHEWHDERNTTADNVGCVIEDLDKALAAYDAREVGESERVLRELAHLGYEDCDDPDCPDKCYLMHAALLAGADALAREQNPMMTVDGPVRTVEQERGDRRVRGALISVRNVANSLNEAEVHEDHEKARKLFSALKTIETWLAARGVK